MCILSRLLSFSKSENQINNKSDKRDKSYDRPENLFASCAEILPGCICNSQNS